MLVTSQPELVFGYTLNNGRLQHRFYEGPTWPVVISVRYIEEDGPFDGSDYLGDFKITVDPNGSVEFGYERGTTDDGGGTRDGVTYKSIKLNGWDGTSVDYGVHVAVKLE